RNRDDVQKTQIIADIDGCVDSREGIVGLDSGPEQILVGRLASTRRLVFPVAEHVPRRGTPSLLLRVEPLATSGQQLPKTVIETGRILVRSEPLSPNDPQQHIVSRNSVLNRNHR